MSNYFKIKGPIPPMILPFKENGDIDYDSYIYNLRKFSEVDLGGYLILGSNGEFCYLSEEEKLRLIEVSINELKDGKLIMVGTGMESTRGTIELTNKAADLGSDCALIITPHFFSGKMTDEALIEYYETVADNVKIPILIYNVTKFTHVNISPRAVKRLANHPNIIGMKDSSGSVAALVSYMNAIESDEFNLIVGSASAWYTAMCIGVEAGILALVNCAAKECVEVQRLFEDKEYEKADDLFKKLFPVNAAVTGKYGIAGLKHACDLVGLKGGSVRRPLLDVSEEDKKDIEAILKKAGVL